MRQTLTASMNDLLILRQYDWNSLIELVFESSWLYHTEKTVTQIIEVVPSLKCIKFWSCHLYVDEPEAKNDLLVFENCIQ